MINKISLISFNSKEAPKAPENQETKAPSAPQINVKKELTPITSKVLTQYPNVKMPAKNRNYCIFDEKKVQNFLMRGEAALPEISKTLETSTDEKQVVEALYTLNRMIDNGVKGVDKMYPILSKFNDTNSANIQTFLAGIYRKTLVPDGFGPLVKMLIKDCNAQKAPKAPEKKSCQDYENFDATEEIGGAILEYIKKYSVSPKNA